MSAIRTAIRRAAISGECACNPARAVSVASVARFSSLVRAAPVARAAPVFPVRAFSSTPLRLSQKVQRDAWAANPIITYAELKPITQQPTDDILLIDVREPDEVALGSIPSAVNLPLSRLDEALAPNFHPGEFQKEFAFPKPLPAQKIIFFCRSGKRSATACELAGKDGYANVRNYVGSMLEWNELEHGIKPDN